MMDKIFQYWRVGLAVCLLAVIVNLEIISAATDDDVADFKYDDHDTFEEAVIAYHTTVNDIFNKKIDLLINNDAENLNIQYIEGEDCEEDNVSTLCLAELIVAEYIDFISSIDDYKVVSSEEGGTLEDLTTLLSWKKTMVDLEKDAAYRTMNQALAVYNELQIMYPIHLQYEVIIETLESYNKSVADWRKEIRAWPTDFIDVSTNKCS